MRKKRPPFFWITNADRTKQRAILLDGKTPIPKGWRPGKKFIPATRKYEDMRWINDGLEQQRLIHKNAKLPLGWGEGMLLKEKPLTLTTRRSRRVRFHNAHGTWDENILKWVEQKHPERYAVVERILGIHNLGRLTPPERELLKELYKRAMKT